MKQSFLSGVLLFLVLLISFYHLSARFIADKRGEQEVELTQITDREDTELMNQLFGVEACDAGDDECLKRRMISEAHLDYIYTQNLKPSKTLH
ncbi:putative phytosulfokines 6 isoform X2 [Hibiscus syriacus]|uniref:putative phytosulfokines 6 isoform X2 n=1 Tax=Hibiscus syriacus TaxID=106335 RepID=UPI001920E17B|nr:putative phytosulfokines 6 isoform X2 [Hibiscus syriacus]